MTDTPVVPKDSGSTADSAPSRKYSLSPAAMLEFIADAYREAALGGVNMRSATEVLEAVRTGLGEEHDYFKAWEQLDNHIGRTLDKRLRRVVAHARDRFVDQVTKGEVARLTEVLTNDQSQGWDEWLRTHAEALTNWRVLLAKALCEAPLPFSANVLPVLKKIERGTNLVIEEQWPETFAMFRYLSQQVAIPRLVRGRLLVVAGEIEIYQLKRLAPGKKLFDEAHELAPEEPRVSAGLGEYCLQNQEFEDASRYFQKVIDLLPDSGQGHVLMGDCADQQREPARAEEAYQNAIRIAPGETAAYGRLLRTYSSPEKFPTYENRLLPLLEISSLIDPTNEYSLLLDLGAAYQQSARYEEAQAWYDKALRLNDRRPAAYLSKAYTYLEQKNFDDARAMFAKAIEVAPGAADGYWGLYYLYDLNQEWPEAIDAYEKSLLRGPLSAGNPDLLDDKSVPATFDEFKHSIFEAFRSEPTDTATLNTLTTLADLYRKAGRVADALQVYEKIRDAKGADYEADYQNLVGNTKYSVKDFQGAAEAYAAAIKANPSDTVFHSNLSLAYQGLKQWNQARAALDAVKAVKGEENYDTYADKMAGLWNAEANDFFGQGKYEEAIESYRQAIDFNDKEAVYYSNLAFAWERLWPVKRELEALQNARSALELATVLAPKNQDYQRRLGNLEGQLRMAKIYGPQIIGKTPVVTPLAIEMASNLVPFVANDESQLSEELQSLTEALRDRIATSFGVRISGIRFRGNEGDLPSGAYIIMLMEVPMVMGTIDIKKRLFTGSEVDLTSLGVPFERAVNPLTGAEAFWVEEEQCKTIKDAGLKTWSLLEYPIRHLESLISDNLDEFIDHQEASNLLEREAGAAKPEDLTEFTSVLKALVSEKVPILAFSQVVTKLNESLAQGKDLTTIIEEVRSLPEIRSSLWGNSAAYSFYRMGEQITKDIAKSVRTEQGHHFLAMLPEDCQDALASVRDNLSSGRNVALVVERPELRPLIRRLTELEWPNVPVLSMPELLPELAGRIVGEI